MSAWGILMPLSKLTAVGADSSKVVVELAARGGPRLLDQPLADALALAGFVDGEIGEIAAEAEIGQRPGEADQPAVLTRGHEQVGVGQHALDPGAILDRPVEA